MPDHSPSRPPCRRRSPCRPPSRRPCPCRPPCSRRPCPCRPPRQVSGAKGCSFPLCGRASCPSFFFLSFLRGGVGDLVLLRLFCLRREREELVSLPAWRPPEPVWTCSRSSVSHGMAQCVLPRKPKQQRRTCNQSYITQRRSAACSPSDKQNTGCLPLTC